MSPYASHACVDVSDGVRFCYPRRIGEAFLLAVDPEVVPDTAQDQRLLVDFFEDPSITPSRLVGAPEDLSNIADWRLYDINRYLPQIVTEKVWRQGRVPGPNCYSAALCASGLDFTCGRYVDGSEVKFWLSIFFEPIENEYCESHPGAVAIFDSQTSVRRNDSGEHMTYSLLGGVVFHKLSYHIGAGYVVSTADRAMSLVEDASRRYMDRFERLASSSRSIKYSQLCYKKKGELGRIDFSGVERPALPETRREYYLKLFRFYSAQIKEVSDQVAGEPRFEDVRLSLLTIENFWHVIREFQKEAGYKLNDLLSDDMELAVAFFTAYSLKWQYQTMSDYYYPLDRDPTKRRLKALYLEHYIKPDDPRFHREIEIHLRFLGTPEEELPETVSAVIGELMREENGRRIYNPLTYYTSNGSRGAPFFKILENTIHTNPTI